MVSSAATDTMLVKEAHTSSSVKDPPSTAKPGADDYAGMLHRRDYRVLGRSSGKQTWVFVARAECRQRWEIGVGGNRIVSNPDMRSRRCAAELMS